MASGRPFRKAQCHCRHQADAAVATAASAAAADAFAAEVACCAATESMRYELSYCRRMASTRRRRGCGNSDVSLDRKREAAAARAAAASSRRISSAGIRTGDQTRTLIPTVVSGRMPPWPDLRACREGRTDGSGGRRVASGKDNLYIGEKRVPSVSIRVR